MMDTRWRARSRRIWAAGLGLLLAVALLGLVAGSTTSYAAAPVVVSASTKKIAPDISVAADSRSVTAGGQLGYKITIDNSNDNRQDLSNVSVTVHFDSNALTLISSKLRDDKDFVSDVDASGAATVRFGSIKRDDSRSATLIFQVNPSISSARPIDAYGEYRWQTADASGSGTIDTFRVIAYAAGAPTSAGMAPAAGPAGTVYQINATSFAAGEYIVTWLNTPGGVQALDLSGEVDSNGLLQLQLDSSGLAPGDYQLVLHSQDSGQEQVLPFSVTAS